MQRRNAFSLKLEVFPVIGRFSSPFITGLTEFLKKKGPPFFSKKRAYPPLFADLLVCDNLLYSI